MLEGGFSAKSIVLFPLVVFFLGSLTCAFPPISGTVVVGDYTLEFLSISSAPVGCSGPLSIEYVLEVRLLNNGSPFEAAVAAVEGAGPGTELVDCAAVFGPVPNGAWGTAVTNVRIHQDASVPLDPDTLFWSVQATDSPADTCADSGLVGDGLTLCHAYCDALGCLEGSDGVCRDLREAYKRIMFRVLFPCDPADEPPVTETPPLEPIEIEADIPHPPGMIRAVLAPDAAHVIIEFEEGESQQIGIMDLAGSNFECVTCGFLSEAAKAQAFEDSQRLLVSHSTVSGIGEVQYEIVECAPSLYDCQDMQVLPIRFPINSLSEGAQNREAVPHPDGKHIKWTEVRIDEGTRMTVGRLDRQAGEYVVINPFVVNPAYQLDGGLESWIHGSRFYEAGDWADGGRTLKYGTTGTALNYDTFELDMATGTRRQVTIDLDYNELYAASPDGLWLASSSARGLDRMDIFTQLVRPPLIDMVAFGQVGRVGLWNNRRCMNEYWLMDRQGQRGTYAGQPVITEDNWNIRGWSWFPDGTRALLKEERIPNEPEPSDPEDRTRLRIIRFPARQPTDPQPIVDLDTLDLSWAVPYDQYQGMASQQVPGYTLQGPVWGEALLNYQGTFATGFWKVQYVDYSDDGLSFVNGTESLFALVANVAATWSVDLTVDGEDNGFLAGTLTVTAPANFQGTVQSYVNGQLFDQVPTQDDCPGLYQPPLVIEQVVASSLDTETLLVEVEVKAEVPEDPVHRPVMMATVEVAGVIAETDDSGWAELIVPGELGAMLTVNATAGSFKPATVNIQAGP